MRALLIGVSAIVPSLAAATETISSIRVFYSDNSPVYQDTQVDGGTVVHVYDMDSNNKATANLNRIVQQQLQQQLLDAQTNQQTTADIKAANQQAFNAVKRSNAWPSLYQQLLESTEPVEIAMRYRIKKLPAIVFNDTDVVYGVDSLKQAITLYHLSKEEGR